MPSVPRDPRFKKFIRLFNDERFFEAHEALEDLWRETEEGSERDFYHALIQIAAAYVHVQRHNPYGWKEMMRKARSYLSGCDKVFPGFPVKELLQFCDREGFSGQLPKLPENL